MPTPGFTAGLSLSEGRDTVVGAFANKLVHDPRRSRTQNVLGQLKVSIRERAGSIHPYSTVREKIVGKK